MEKTKFIGTFRILFILCFIYEFLCLLLLSKGIGGYLVISNKGSQLQNLNQGRLVLILLMFMTAYVLVNYDKHNNKLNLANDPKITVKSLRSSQIAIIIIMTSASWLVS